MRTDGDYISREAAIEYLTLNMEWQDGDGYPVDDWDERKAHIADLINGIPAADVVPVVRCRDCRFARFGPEWIICENFNGLCTTALGLEDFCSHGERRARWKAVNARRVSTS